MIRKIIHINRELCNGCGLCVDACHEGAIGLVEGRAALLRDDYCDGLGDCLPVCPTGAITFEEREAAAYDEAAVLESKGGNHSRTGELPCGCPGSQARVIERQSREQAGGSGMTGEHGAAYGGAAIYGGQGTEHGPAAIHGGQGTEHGPAAIHGGQGREHGPAAIHGGQGTEHEPAAIHGGQGKGQEAPRSRGTSVPAAAAPEETARPISELRQWPVQIKLVPVNAPYFKDAHLLVAADCTAYARSNFHTEFMKNKITLIGCPKLDDGDYSEKLTAILKENNIKSVTVARMEVPCCAGIENQAKKALKDCGKMIPWQVTVISTDGRLLDA